MMKTNKHQAQARIEMLTLMVGIVAFVAWTASLMGQSNPTPTSRSVVVNTNSVVVYPTNFWTANESQIPIPAGAARTVSNLSDLANLGTARTNLGAHNASNITTGALMPARLYATNTGSTNNAYLFPGYWGTVASGGSGSGDVSTVKLHGFLYSGPKYSGESANVNQLFLIGMEGPGYQGVFGEWGYYGQLSLYDTATSTWVARTITPTSDVSIIITTDLNSDPVVENTNYDVFAKWDTGTSAIVLGCLPWTDDSTHDLDFVSGRVVRDGDPEWRYVGSFRTTDSDTWVDNVTPFPETESTISSRLVWSEFNRVEMQMYAKFPTSAGTSTYTTDSYAHTGGAIGEDTVQFLIGRQQDWVHADARITVANSGGEVYVDAKPVLDSSAGVTEPFGQYAGTNKTLVTGKASWQPADGFHNVKLYRRSQASGTSTWTLGTTGVQAGIRAMGWF